MAALMQLGLAFVIAAASLPLAIMVLRMNKESWARRAIAWIALVLAGVALLINLASCAGIRIR